MNQMVNCRSVTADARVPSQAMYVKFCVINGAMGQVYIQVLRVSTVSTSCQCPTRILTLLTSEVQIGKAWKTSHKSVLSYIKYTFKLCF